MRYLCSSAAVIVCLTPQVSFAQNDGNQAVLQKIFSDWRDRQDLLKTARYVITGSIEYKDKELPAGNPVRPRRVVLLLDLERKRWRLETSQEDISANGGKGLTYVHTVFTSAFDGTARQTYYHRDLNRIEGAKIDLGIDKAKQSGGAFDPSVWPVFFAHGIVGTPQHELHSGDLPTTYDTDNFEVRGRQSFHGRSCTVVRTMPMPYAAPLYYELWIDSNQKSAIHRSIEFSGPNPWHRDDVDWKQTDFGWWPDKWAVTWTKNLKVRRIHRFQVESFEPNVAVADGDFILQAKPGMTVVVTESIPPGQGLNPNLPPTTTYLISASGSWQEVGARGYTTVEGQVLPAERNRRWIWWMVAAAAALAAMGFGYYVWRRSVKLDVTPGK